MASPFRFGDNASSFDYDASLQRMCSLLEQLVDETRKTNEQLVSLREEIRDIKDYVRYESDARLNRQPAPWELRG